MHPVTKSRMRKGYDTYRDIAACALGVLVQSAVGKVVRGYYRRAQ